MSFTAAEADHLASQPLARFSTIDEVGQPDVVPVAFEFDGTDVWIGGSGETFLGVSRAARCRAG